MGNIMKHVTWANGNQEWRINDYFLHREDGPAILYVNGYQEWWLYGKLHREDGPAIISSDGWSQQEWFVNDQRVTNEVKKWMLTQKVTWPWDEEVQAQFLLTFI